jgi:hypothetical protein
MRSSGAGLAVGALLALWTGSPAVAAPNGVQDAISCSWQGRFDAAPGFGLSPRGGTLQAGATGAGTCSGDLNGNTLDGSDLELRLIGEYGAQSTCAFAVGASEVQLAIARATTVYRLAGVHDWWASALHAGATGMLGGASSQLAFGLASSQSCGSGRGVASGTMSITVSARGDIRRLPNLRPHPRLAVSPERITGHGPVDIDAEVADADGSSDLRGVAVVVRDDHGRVLGSWGDEELQRRGATTLTLAVRDFKLRGPHPWRVELSGTDRARHDFTRSVTLRRK